MRIVITGSTGNIGSKLVPHLIDREVTFVQVPPEAAKESMLAMGMSDDMASSLVELYAGIDTGHLTGDVERTPEATMETTLETFAKEVLKPAIEA